MEKEERRGSVAERYSEHTRRNTLLILAAFTVLAAAVLSAVSLGGTDIPFWDVMRCLFTFDTASDEGWTVWGIRMPRITAAVLAGAGLSVAGVVMQCILRNPLASPYTLGLSNAAAFGAAFAIIFLQGGSVSSFGIDLDNPYAVASCAFLFSMMATGAVMLLSRYAGVSAETVVLAGVAISAMFTAGMTLMQYMADSTQLGAIVSWTFGNLGKADWGWDAAIFFVGVPIVIYFMLNRWSLNAMNAGDEVAEGVGVGTARFRMIGLVLSALLSSILVAGFGVIAFVGLLGPHISRMIVGSDHRSLIPMSLVLGAAIMLIADTVARTAMSPMVLPVGILTSLLGGPLFIYLLLSRSRRRTYV
ncbi:MAG: iron ABC transporter permease [Candidatus Methanomethylophilaceae archaeon]|jgi:iron complex transport system permease protein|nr:iron ABC transporter permease [Candidatus Methanomethylophilaceae archaeon]NLF33778.1 iron ABC transporter permease [Thermoplasmatales archaeon]